MSVAENAQCLSTVLQKLISAVQNSEGSFTLIRGRMINQILTEAHVAVDNYGKWVLENGGTSHVEDKIVALNEARDKFRQTNFASAARQYLLAAYDAVHADTITWNEFIAVVGEIGVTQIIDYK